MRVRTFALALSGMALIAHAKEIVLPFPDTANVALKALPDAPVPGCSIAVSAPSSYVGTAVTATIAFTPATPTGWLTSAKFWLEGAPDGERSVDPYDPALHTATFTPNGPAVLTFRGWVTGPGGTSTCQQTIDVSYEPPACTLTVSPATVQAKCGLAQSTSWVTIAFSGGPVEKVHVAGESYVVHPPFPAALTFDGRTPKLTPPPPIPVEVSVPNYQKIGEFGATIHGPGGTTHCVPAKVKVDTYCDPTVYRVDSETSSYPLMDPPMCNYNAVNDNGVDFIANRGCKPGCFQRDTRLRLGNGSLKAAADVRWGDLLWNPVTRRPVRVKRIIRGPEKLPLIEIPLAGDRLRVTAMHPMITSRGVVAAKALVVGDRLLGRDLAFHVVRSLGQVTIPAGELVYNFELETDSALEKDHYVEAAGVVTGDYYLQVRLETGGIH